MSKFVVVYYTYLGGRVYPSNLFSGVKRWYATRGAAEAAARRYDVLMGAQAFEGAEICISEQIKGKEVVMYSAPQWREQELSDDSSFLPKE